MSAPRKPPYFGLFQLFSKRLQEESGVVARHRSDPCPEVNIENGPCVG
ncbi:MAG: hypothetical protein JKP92_02860 [Alphaproteobacteria bacterium]|nr:hypothetical protein [Alphaproteobacteria bacterium]